MLDSANLWRQIQFSGRYLVVLLRKCLVFRQFWHIPSQSLWPYWPIRVAAALLLMGLAGCGSPRYDMIRGATMGTYYAVHFAAGESCAINQQQIEASLKAVNDAMSTYQADSELSLINQSLAYQNNVLSSDLRFVMDAALQLAGRSGGAFDVTVGPLVNLWGFGPQAQTQAPSAKAQAMASKAVGMEHLTLDGSRLVKHLDSVYIDLSALGKGFAVDQLADLLADMGCVSYMVDIGGEIRVAGLSPRGEVWRIGVEVPDPSRFGMFQTVLEVTDNSVATSGDYRNYRVVDGRRIDHVIDPRSGSPANNTVVSVTILHPSAMWADAYATTLMVLGLDAGMRFAEQEGLAAYVIARLPQGDLVTDDMLIDVLPADPLSSAEPAAEERFEFRYTSAMQPYLPAALSNAVMMDGQ